MKICLCDQLRWKRCAVRIGVNCSDQSLAKRMMDANPLFRAETARRSDEGSTDCLRLNLQCRSIDCLKTKSSCRASFQRGSGFDLCLSRTGCHAAPLHLLISFLRAVKALSHQRRGTSVYHKNHTIHFTDSEPGSLRTRRSSSGKRFTNYGIAFTTLMALPALAAGDFTSTVFKSWAQDVQNYLRQKRLYGALGPLVNWTLPGWPCKVNGPEEALADTASAFRYWEKHLSRRFMWTGSKNNTERR